MEPWSVTLAVTALVGVSGWATLAYQHFTARPKLRSSLINVMRGLGTINDVPRTSFWAYLYLTNTRRNQVHILDYGMEVRVRGRWVTLDRVYGVTPATSFTFQAESGRAAQVLNLADKLIWRNHTPVQFGLPHHGFLFFVGPPDLHPAPIKKYRITCIDAFQKAHRFTTPVGAMRSPYLLSEMAGVDLPADVMPPTLPR